MLKETELMIGDWVYDKINSQDVKIAQMYLIPEWCDNFLPISLTPEILEKNGFKASEHDSRKYSFHDDEKRIEIIVWLCNGEYEMPMGILKNEYLEDEISYTLPEPFFVHQYQHALRLCGFDGFADDFKI